MRNWLAYHATGLARDVGTVLLGLGLVWAGCFAVLGIICAVSTFHDYLRWGWPPYPPWYNGDLRAIHLTAFMFGYAVPPGRMAAVIGWCLRRWFPDDPDQAVRRVVKVALEAALNAKVRQTRRPNTEPPVPDP